MARLARIVLACLVLAPAAGAEARDPSVRVDRGVIESLGPLPPAPRLPAGAPRAAGLPLAPDTLPQAAPERRAAPRPRTAPARRAARGADPSLPLPLPPEEPVAPPPRAALPAPPVSPPLPTPPREAAPPPQVAAPAAGPPPTAPAEAAGPPPVVPQPAPAAPAEVAARPEPARAAPPPSRTPAGSPPARVQLLFEPGVQELSAAMRAELRALAAALPEDEATRLTVNAYAGGDPANPSLARRASLTRALAVRTALMEAGVRSTRIDVRALGLNAGDGPADRVDVLVGPSR
ncbi:OmpA family protein [Elioraea sp.]|uniref:OmpA family protein n=1 Tax=Elioraea sp. TaxID=2185103 RepID=UPI0021DC0831|nr:OmpA family protein [Elioraea sp.]GIX09247.1 MAG: hypothetical protein KatS3mg116_0957 [Elioraea sp.]